MRHRVAVVTVTLGRPSLEACCRSIDLQSDERWHHYVLGDGVAPREYRHAQRSTLGFTNSLGVTEPALNMPNGTPNPLLRWAIRHVELPEFLCFLDDDNVYEADFLACMVQALDERRDAGIALCAVTNERANWRDIDGFPEYRRCDNSAFLVRSEFAKAVGFPAASRDRECVQDYEFISAVANQHGWVRVPRRLVRFGSSDNPPPARGGIAIVDSWALPVRGAECMRSGRYDAAEQLLEQSVRINSSDAWAWWHLGEVRLCRGRPNEAEEAWAKWRMLVDSVGEFPDDWTHYTYALAAVLHGLEEVASQHLEVAVTRAQRNEFAASVLQAENEVNLALYHVLRGAKSDVDAHLQRAAGFGLDPRMLVAGQWKLGIVARVLSVRSAQSDRHRLCLETTASLETLLDATHDCPPA